MIWVMVTQWAMALGVLGIVAAGLRLQAKAHERNLAVQRARYAAEISRLTAELNNARRAHATTLSAWGRNK